jgi:hypothetical protein
MRLSNRFACASTIEISPSVNELRKTLLRTLLKVGRYICAVAMSPHQRNQSEWWISFFFCTLKVIIVLSRGYVESKWCQFELHLSQHRLLESERRDALVLILLEDVPKQQQNAGLRYLMSTRTYLAWRSDSEGQQLFWQRLRQVLMARPYSSPSKSEAASNASTW